MMRCIAVSLLLLSCATAGNAATTDRFVILPESMSGDLLGQCSRPVPKAEGTWAMTVNDARQLEADLSRLNGMKAHGCCNSWQRRPKLDDDTYLRQYVGIIVRGRRYIYINAFQAKVLDAWPKQVPRPDWRRKPFGACDGGTSFWGALYDPATRRFSELAFNGVG